MLYDWMVAATPTWSPRGSTRRISPLQRSWHGTLGLRSPSISVNSIGAPGECGWSVTK